MPVCVSTPILYGGVHGARISAQYDEFSIYVFPAGCIESGFYRFVVSTKFTGFSLFTLDS